MMKNLAASVRTRLLNLSRERGEDFQLVLTRFANERLLYRLSQSPHAAQFILKGAALFTVWTGNPHRATRDLDFLGFGDSSIDHLRETFRSVLQIAADDGLEFDLDTLSAGPIREDQVYGGVRIEVFARLTSAKTRLQIDIGFGDAVTPGPVEIEFPGLLDFPAARLRGYPRETVVAEKLNAIVELGIANSRMKDFYDLAVLARNFAFDGPNLTAAIKATFDRRSTNVSDVAPVGLTKQFSEDATKRQQWAGFVRKTGARDALPLADTVLAVAEFVGAPLAAAARGGPVPRAWSPGGPWTQSTR